MRRGPLYLLLLTAMLAAIGILMLSTVLVVREVHIVNAAGLEEETVISAAGIEPKQSIFRLNRESIAEGISSIGTHALEEMRMIWPDVVELTLRERELAAMLACDGGMAVVDGDCVVVELVQQAPGRDLIYISGADGGEALPGQTFPLDGDRLSACRTVLGAVERSGAAALVSELNLENWEELRLITRGGMTVLLGNEEDMERKIAWMQTAVRDLSRRGMQGGRLDVRFDGHADYTGPMEGAADD